jgi:hypothetical protein
VSQERSYRPTVFHSTATVLGPDQTFDERPPKFHFIISLTEHPNFEKISQNFTPLNYFNPKYEIEIFLEIWALSCFNRRRACCSSALWLPGSGQPALNADRCRIGSQRARTRAQRLQKSTAVRKQRVRPRSTSHFCSRFGRREWVFTARH